MRVLVIGGTGMLGRPVVRRLAAAGLAVRAIVRDVERARAVLPTDMELVSGDLRDAASLRRAMAGVEAVYVNLSCPMGRHPPTFSPELDGTRAVVAAAESAGVERVLRISAMGVDEATPQWWAAAHKQAADRVLMDSGLAWTIFRPTWFSESLATMAKGGVIVRPGPAHAKLRWIAGEDYAEQVSTALRQDATIGRIDHPQGPQHLSIREAIARFVRVWPRRLRVMPVPLWVQTMGGLVSGSMHYLAHLMRMTRDHFARVDLQFIPTDLPQATTTIEQYVASIERTGDLPRK